MRGIAIPLTLILGACLAPRTEPTGYEPTEHMDAAIDGTLTDGGEDGSPGDGDGGEGGTSSCTRDQQCEDNPSASRCDEAAGSCARCETSADCAALPATPVCDAEKGCVECSAAEAGACAAAGKVCMEGGNLCVACNENADCPDDAPHCDAHVCTACSEDADCEGRLEGATALDACVAGRCMDCRVDQADTRVDYGCSASASCDPATRTCTGKPKGTVGICAACVADSECEPDHRCVAMTFEGMPQTPVGDGGGYCLKLKATGCDRPYGAMAIHRGSLSGAAAEDYCGVNESKTTCEAIAAFGGSCPGGSAAACGAQGAICGTVSGISNTCTYACESGNNVECPGVLLCPAGVSSYCGQN